MERLKQIYAKGLIKEGERINNFFNQLHAFTDVSLTDEYENEELYGVRIEYVRDLALDAVTAQFLLKMEE